ncbi:MAG: hypothetical protein L0K86_26180, partial [Actinomycetia bacterium]|nr:hypothetical protein [Actinomycetes bacterium]
MDASQPGLFDLPDEEPPAAPERSKRGRNRETWSCSVTADVTVVDEAAIRQAVSLAEENGLVVDIGPDSAVEDA